MKIRTDFVTNSSSASYTLELGFTNTEGKTASMSTEAGEGGRNEDGWMLANAVSLTPDGVSLRPDEVGLTSDKEEKELLFEGRSLANAKSINELCDILFSAAWVEYFRGYEIKKYVALNEATFVIKGNILYYSDDSELKDYIIKKGGLVSDTLSEGVNYLICNNKDLALPEIEKVKEFNISVISELDFVRKFDKDRFDDVWETISRPMPLKEIAPKTMAHFLQDCIKKKISIDNLQTIDIKNCIAGYGDSAKYVETEVFEDYHKRYSDASSEEEKKAIFQEMVDYMKSEPELLVWDNEGMLPETMRCGWLYSERELKAAVKGYLEGTGENDYWMGEYVKHFIINFKEGVETTKERLLLGYGADFR